MCKQLGNLGARLSLSKLLFGLEAYCQHNVVLQQKDPEPLNGKRLKGSLLVVLVALLEFTKGGDQKGMPASLIKTRQKWEI